MAVEETIACPGCGRGNRAGRRFCGGCGASLAPRCERCGSQNEPGDRFCGDCGGPLAAGAASSSTLASSAASAASSTLIATGSLHPVSATPLPGAFGGGRYQVDRFLGEGARKRVYLARDERLQREVALAVIKAEGLDADGLTRVRREAEALGRLGDHPNVVTVHDVVEEGGQVLIVTQYLAGGDLEALVRNAEGGRLGLADALCVGAETCAALEHAHAKGIIHRDVKPGNIWFDDAGAAKLGDFGLALSVDRSRISHHGSMIGTAAYMPPEQALGRAPDARSDLYALGAVLYEMLTGRPPFVGDDAVALISQHINTPPVAPSWHNAEIPRPVEELVLALLAKDPEARPASAGEVSARIAQLAAAPSTPAEAEPAEALNPLDRLASGVFVGREEEMETLRRSLDDALSARGGVLMLVGEPGIGKTRTSEELATYARMRGAQVLWGHCYEGEGAPVYWPWVQIVRAYVHERDPGELRSQMGAGAADIASVVSEVREQLPDLDEPQELEADQARFRLFDSITTFIKNASQQSPLVLVLDDLHWSDSASLALLEFMAREISTSRVLILGTYRDVELGRTHPLERTLAGLSAQGLTERVLLRGISRADVGRYIERAAHLKPPKALIDAVYRETEGNPFFTGEVVRLLESTGRLAKAAEGSEWSVEVPQGVKQVVGRRLSGLSAECNEVMAAGAVIGRDFDLDLLERVSEASREELIATLDEAVVARLLEEDGERFGRYRFAHALVQHTLLDELSTPRRIRLHRVIGDHLESLHGSDIGPHLAEIAHHFFQASQMDGGARGVEFARRAGDYALERLAYEEAVAHYGRAVQLIELQDEPDAERLCELLVLLAEAHKLSGDRSSLQSSPRAAAAARAIDSPEMFARAVLAYTSFPTVNMGSVDSTRVALLEEALERLPDEPAILRARVLTDLGTELFFGMDKERLDYFASKAIAEARAVGDPKTLSYALIRSSMFSASTLDVHRIMADLEEAAALAREAGEVDALIDVLVGTVGMHIVCCDLPAATEVAAELARESARVRSPFFQYFPRLHAATLALLQGDWDAFETASREAFDIGRATVGGNALQWYAAQQALHQFFLGGDVGAGIPLWKELTESRGEYPVYPIALSNAYARTGRLDEAREVVSHLVATGFETIPQDGNWRISLALLAQNATLLGDTDWARMLYELMLPARGTSAMVGAAAAYYGSLDLRMGQLASMLGLHDEALDLLEGALANEVRMGARPWEALVHQQLGRALVARGAPGDREAAQAAFGRSLELGRELGMKPMVEEVLAEKLRLQGSSTSDTTRSILAVADTVEAHRPDLSPAAAPDGTVTLMFSDMQGFTAMTERLGDVRAHALVQEHNGIVRELTAAHGGHEVELRGDGFLLAFSSARRAVLCAIALQRRFDAYCREHPDEPIRVRIGLHTGETIKDADKFFGKSVIQAFRIADQADGGEILVSSLLKQLTDSGGDLRFDAGRELELKGLAGKHRVYAVEWR